MTGSVKWAVRGKNKKYWQLGGGSSNIVCDAVSASDSKSHFHIEWHGAQVCIYSLFMFVLFVFMRERLLPSCYSRAIN